MQPFADLLDALSYQPARNGKLALIADYLRRAPDPDRGYALAALCGEIELPGLKPAALREMAQARVDPELFGWSYDYVGDLAETIALIWPADAAARHPAPRQSPHLGEVIERLRLAARPEAMMLMADWLDGLDPTGRWALLKLCSGALRVGVSARLAKTALAQLGDVALEEIEEIWPQHAPPYAGIFAWVTGAAPRPAARNVLGFRPLMLSHPIEDGDFASLAPHDFAAEWKWDGIRVQIAASGGGQARLYSRAGEEITQSFPDLVEALDFDAVLDGELLVARRKDDAIEIAPFNDLQQRLNRKKPSAALILAHPAHVRLYDVLSIGGEDLRPLPLRERRARLEAWYAEKPRPRLDLSPLIAFADWAALARLRADARSAGIEGLMLKRWESPYLAGRIKGHWFKWKRDALTIDAVLMYAQRGHGKRSSFYSDFTFGCWRPAAGKDGGDGGRELVPVGKAYSGFTDEELKKLDRFVRNNTVERFGPVRVLAPSLVAEFAFDSVQQSTRHKSGLALRFPRFHRIRWDKPAEEADEVDALKKLMG